MAQLANKSIPYSHLLHKGVTYKWDEKCDQAFNKIKDYLLMPLVLMLPILGKPLILYILEIVATLNALLAQHDENGKERAIYYISRTMVGHELNYTSIDKSCLLVVFVAQKFRHYILTHQMNLIAKIDSLKYLLSKATLIGQTIKWVMILKEHEIEYVEHKAIKGQAIPDQLIEAPIYSKNPFVLEFTDESIFNISVVDH